MRSTGYLVHHFPDLSLSNHPVLKEDAVLTIFLTVSSFEAWRKQTSISLDEESLSRRVDRVEEMSIPSDFEDKLMYVSVSAHADCLDAYLL